MSFTAVITANVSEFEKGIQSAQKSVNGLEKDVSSKLQSVGSKFTELGDKVKFVSAAFLAAGAASFKMAADFQDAIGATDQIFKTNSKVVQDWAKNLPSMYGIATKEALEYSNKMATMLVNIGGLTEEQAGKQSASLIELAGDLTAMFGGETKDAVWTLTAALKGNVAMLDNYGIAANDALIKARAFEMGLVEQDKEMSLTAKQAAILSIIYEQTAAAQGQAAREADGASGVMRALGVEFKNLSTEIGERLLPVFTPMISSLRDLVANLRNVSPEVITAGLVFGGLVIAAAPLLLIIGKIIALLPTLIAGFAAVKVAIIAMTGPIGLLVAAIAAAVFYIATNFKEVIGTITAVFDFFMSYIKTAADFWKSIVTLDFKNSLELLRKNYDVVFGSIYKIVRSALSEISGALADFLGFVGLDKWGASVKSFANKMSSSFGGATVSVKEVTKAIDGQKKAVEAVIPNMENLTENTKKLTTANTKLKDIDAFTKLIGDGSNLNEIVVKTVEQIQLMTARLEGLQSGTIKVKNVKSEIEKTKKSISELTTAFETLTGKSGSLATASLGALETPKLGFGDGGLIPAPTFDLEAASKTLTDLGNFKEAVATNFIELGNLAASGLGAFADAIGNALGSGNFDDLGGELISALGSLAQQFGGMLISFGLASKQLQLLITNPIAAIAAGAALIALGAAAKASATKMVSNATSGGSYSTGGTSAYQSATTSTVGASDYRGQYQDDYTVNFKIGSNELVGVLEMANQRKSRL